MVDMPIFNVVIDADRPIMIGKDELISKLSLGALGLLARLRWLEQNEIIPSGGNYYENFGSDEKDIQQYILELCLNGIVKEQE